MDGKDFMRQLKEFVDANPIHRERQEPKRDRSRSPQRRRDEYQRFTERPGRVSREDRVQMAIDRTRNTAIMASEEIAKKVRSNDYDETLDDTYEYLQIDDRLDNMAKQINDNLNIIATNIKKLCDRLDASQPKKTNGDDARKNDDDKPKKSRASA